MLESWCRAGENNGCGRSIGPQRPTGVEEGMLCCAISCGGAARQDLACVWSARIPLQGLHMRSCIIICRAPAQPHSALVL